MNLVELCSKDITVRACAFWCSCLLLLFTLERLSMYTNLYTSDIFAHLDGNGS